MELLQEIPAVFAAGMGIFFLSVMVRRGLAARRYCHGCGRKLAGTHLHRMQWLDEWYCLACYSEQQRLPARRGRW